MSRIQSYLAEKGIDPMNTVVLDALNNHHRKRDHWDSHEWQVKLAHALEELN